MRNQIRWPHALHALRHRNFRLYWTGQIVSLSGSWMQITALNWMAYQRTESAFTLGLVNFIALLPVGPVALVSGVISDRLPRKQLIVMTQTLLAVQALGLTILSWMDLVQIWHIMVVVFVIGAAEAIEQPARLAFLVDVAGKEDLTNAVGLTAVVANIARSVGPAFAGVLMGWAGEGACFLLNSITYLFVIGALLLIRLPPPDQDRKSVRLGADLVSGLKYMWQNNTIRGLLLLIAVSSFLSRSYIVLMPVVAYDVLQVGSAGYGLLLGVIGIGAVCGALMASVAREGSQRRWLIGASLVFPVLLIGFAFSRSIWFSALLLLMVGIGNRAQEVLTSTLLQLAAKDEFRGRVASIFSLLRNGLMRLGGVQTGLMAQVWGAPVAVSIGAALGGGLMAAILIWDLASSRRWGKLSTHHSRVEAVASALAPMHKALPRPIVNGVNLLLRPLDFLHARRYPRDLFAGVEVFCLFVGYPRSGHTLMAALLDAHPEIIISNEMNVLEFVRRRYNQTQIFSLALHNSRSFARRGSKWGGYSYVVPGQWQGRFRALKCIGDEKGGGTALALSRDPTLLEKLVSTIDREIKWIHVVRNPYDNISTLSLREGWSISRSIDVYFTLVDAVTWLQASVPTDSLLTIRQESLLTAPRDTLALLCAYLHRDAPPAYLDACAKIVFASPRKSRYRVDWSDALLQRVQEQMMDRDCKFLKGYTFEDKG